MPLGDALLYFVLCPLAFLVGLFIPVAIFYGIPWIKRHVMDGEGGWW